MPTATQGVDRPLLAVTLLCAATLCFAIMAGMVKSLTGNISLPQIIWGRYFFHIVIILIVFPFKIPTILVSGRRELQVLRGALVLGATTCAFTALHYIPMANVAAIGFVGPLLVIGMAAALLHERVSLGHWIAVGVGFSGRAGNHSTRGGGNALGLFFTPGDGLLLRRLPNSHPIHKLTFDRIYIAPDNFCMAR